MNKVAEVTAYFWIMKICATTLGETGGDLLSMTMHVGYAISSVILLGLFLVSLAIQLHSNRFNPVLYWTVIVTTSTAGTTMSDFMDRTLGLGYAKGSLSVEKGGLNFGTVGSSLVLATLLVTFIIYTSSRDRRVSLRREGQ